MGTKGIYGTRMGYDSNRYMEYGVSKFKVPFMAWISLLISLAEGAATYALLHIGRGQCLSCSVLVSRYTVQWNMRDVLCIDNRIFN